MTAVVFGGYGVFGSYVCRELAQRGVAVTVAGREARRAEALAAQLGAGHRGIAADATDARSARAALAGHDVAVHCAGPFSAGELTLLDACRDAACHYVDIADDRAYTALVRARHESLRERGLTAVFGGSSLPGLSEALARIARRRYDDPPSRARVTLFIGNDNAKSATAILSVARGVGREIRAPQGRLHGFRDRERVRLPAPFGLRNAYAFESPDYDLLPETVGVTSVSVLVGFESALGGRLLSLLPRLSRSGSARVAAALSRLGALFRSGSSGGTVVVDLFWPDGRASRAGLHAVREGQRLAALPAALAACALETDPAVRRGVTTVAELIGVDEFLAAVTAAGFEQIS